jgi:hypothetical protein
MESFIKNKKMNLTISTKKLVSLGLQLIGLAIFQTVHAQETVPKTVSLPDTSKMTYYQISNALKLLAYPAKGQSQQQQKIDEFECYKWSIQQTGIDPLNLPKIEVAPAQTGPTGGAVKGAARGAAAGAAVGAIAGDAGEGAAIGAVAGGVKGRRAGKQAQKQANAQAEANAAQQEQALKDTFKKGFSVCLEGKGYTVK